MADQDLAGLPEDVREHVANMDARNTVNGSWNAIRAELLRLASSFESAEQFGRNQHERAEHAEAELAALKRRIAEAPIVLCEVKDGADEDDDDIGTFYMPRAYWNVPVVLLPVGGEG